MKAEPWQKRPELNHDRGVNSLPRPKGEPWQQIPQIGRSKGINSQPRPKAEPPPVRLRAPFPYFGGKSRIAAEVWRRFGEVPNYIEPFFGSGAVLLGCPTPPRWETVNDIDALLCNFWRAVKADPEGLAALLDWPVNETDSRARHRWLCRMPGKAEFADRMTEDPDLYDLKRAAWWCWLASHWIGAGICAGEWWGPEDERNCGGGVCNEAEKRPHLTRANGVATVPAKRPNLVRSVGTAQRGVCNVAATRPQLKGACGVSQRLKRGSQPDIAQATPDRLEWLKVWMQALMDRLRETRVCCGDWQRICGNSPTIHCATPVAVFLDPPYDVSRRDRNIYNTDAPGLAAEVRAWALERGDDPRFRIALCGLEGEHPMPDNWECLAWKAAGGYARLHRCKWPKSQNRHLERIWFSPHCLKPGVPAPARN